MRYLRFSVGSPLSYDISILSATIRSRHTGMARGIASRSWRIHRQMAGWTQSLSSCEACPATMLRTSLCYLNKTDTTVQRPCRLRTRRWISSQLSADPGLLRRFCLRRASSAFCQSCTGTSSGVDAMSSQRSSTSCSFSDRLNSKMDSAEELMGVIVPFRRVRFNGGSFVRVVSPRQRALGAGRHISAHYWYTSFSKSRLTQFLWLTAYTSETSR